MKCNRKTEAAGREPVNRRIGGRVLTIPTAFTLIEIMIVVGIIGLILAMGAPTLYQSLNRKGMPRIIGDFVDLCNQARARAIMSGEQTQIVFYPLERRCELVGGAAPGAVRLRGGPSNEVKFDDTVSIQMLEIGMHPFTDQEVAWVSFYPNGTSDEMTLVLQSDKNEWRKISLEIATGMVSVESDRNKWW